MPQTFDIIRDAITINSNLPFFFTGLQPDDTLRLIARQITLVETVDLNGKNLEIYAESFDALNGAVFLNQGIKGADGTPGTMGLKGQDDGLGATINGCAGNPGNAGGDGRPGGVIKVVAEVVKGLNVNAKGGDPGKGGVGGRGGTGGSAKVKMRPGPIFVRLGNGGPGGAGGKGGTGGSGGNITISSTSYTPELTPEQIEKSVSGGVGGESASGGEGGLGGKIMWIPANPPIIPAPQVEREGGHKGQNGPSGSPSLHGPSGVPDKKSPTFEEFWASMASESFAVNWAKHRHNMGEFYFRTYIPGSPDRDRYIGMAVDEFKLLSDLTPRRTQVLSGSNRFGTT